MTSPEERLSSLNVVLSIDGDDIKNMQFRRDEARCLATEEIYGDLKIYTVSLHNGSKANHLNCNFASRTFVDELLAKFGVHSKFEQICLDWFWSQDGWDNERWSYGFFERTIPSLSKVLVSSGAVYLPFKTSCFIPLIQHLEVIEAHYDVSYLSEHDARDEVMLVRGTELTPKKKFAELLEKPDDQMDYCGFTLTKLREKCPMTLSSTVLQNYKSIQMNHNSVRFIRLTRLDGRRLKVRGETV